MSKYLYSVDAQLQLRLAPINRDLALIAVSHYRKTAAVLIRAMDIIARQHRMALPYRETRLLFNVTALNLPIVEVIDSIRRELECSDELVLEAPPGAGKTTVVPLALLNQSWLANQKIVMLEPRRLAARAAAERMAQLLGEKPGQTVGYRMRFDSCVSADTRIEVITEGVFTRLLQDDPSLDGVGLVIFDEFHERSLDADLGLALTLNGRQLFGDLRETPLKLMMMSATLDGSRVSDLLGQAPVVSSQGKMFPVSVRYGQPYAHGQRVAERVTATIEQALADESGSLLVFLPGQREIRQTEQLLRARLGHQADVSVAPLFGNLSLEAQRAAIDPAPAGQRKIVLATNIAETSLTIEGVRVVVDSGLCREPQFDPRTGMTRLATKRIAKSSATQRMGRAGRLETGVCYRLWSESQDDELAKYPQPEILQADLTPLALQLLQWGVAALDELQWMDLPSAGAWRQALQLLRSLGAARCCDETWRITAHGELMAQLPCHPRLAHLLIKARTWDCQALGVDTVALLSERDLAQGQGVDFQIRLDMLRGDGRLPSSAKGLWQRVKQQSKQLSRALKRVDVKAGSVSLKDLAKDQQLGLLLACSYPDRIAKPRASQRSNYQLSNGRSAKVMGDNTGFANDWLVVADLAGVTGETQDRIYQAARVSIADLQRYLPELVERNERLDWCAQAGRFVAEEQVTLGAIQLASRSIANPDAKVRNQALLNFVRESGMTLFERDEETRQWLARIELLRGLDLEKNPNSEWPDVSDTGILASLDQWLLPHLDSVRKLIDFKKLNLRNALQTLLAWPLPKQLDEWAPSRIKVASGNSVAIDYTQRPPVLAVKLQEMFGCTETPRIAQGRQALLIHLLSPAGRPLQVTQDLAGFWSGSYAAVKKEMKGRYPKHPWPDNPIEAVATAKTKNRLKQ